MMDQNTGMSASDWSSWVTMVVALCALISPLLTTLCNNWHQRKMKQLEYKQHEREEQLRREREIYEGYIRSAGAVLQSKTKESSLEFGEHSRLAMYYVPDKVREKMLQFETIVNGTYPYDSHFEQRAQLLDEIIVMLRDDRESRSLSDPQQLNKTDTTA